MLGQGQDRSVSGQVQVTGTCECINKPSDSIKCMEFLDKLRIGYLLKKDSAPCSKWKKESTRIPFIFNDESAGSCICLRLDLYMSHVKHDTIITCSTAVCFCFYLSSPTPPTNRSHTCLRNAYQG
jgi:hypothetical protein